MLRKGRFKMKLLTRRLAVIAAVFVCALLASCHSSLFPIEISGLFIYTVGDLDVGGFKVDPSAGTVKIVPGSPFASAFTQTNSPCPDLAGADPAGKFLYVPDECNDNIVAFKIDNTTGTLTPIAGSPFPTNTGNFGAYQPVVDPTGKFLYVTEDTDQVLGFTIGANGALTPIAGSPFSASPNFETSSLAMHPSGKFLYVSGDDDEGLPLITIFSINSTSGVLSQTAGSPFYVNESPGFMDITPSGKFLYVTSPEDDGVMGFSIDAITGDITELASSPFTAGPNPQGIDVSPDGKFVFVANEADEPDTTGNVSAYTINSTTGALTEVAGSPFTGGPNPGRLVVDPNSKFLFVTNQDSDNMSVFSINQTTGVLTQITGSPFATNIGSEGITIVHR